MSVEMLRHVRTAMASQSSHAEVDRLYIKDIILNRLSSSRIEPCPGTLDALIDDMVHYMEKSVADFAEFMKEKKSLDSTANPE